MILLRNITKTYEMGSAPVRALRAVSTEIACGEFVAIMGPSGSGKSTLMHIMGLLDVPDSGSYELMGRDTTSLSDDDLANIRNSTIGFVFQHFNLLARTSALENVALPMLYSQRHMDISRARRALERVGLGERARHKPNELSGGQQQRVAIARALIQDPMIILADEPTGNLDSASAMDILNLLADLNESGMTVVLVTHEHSVAERARRIIRMQDGEIKSDDLAEKTAATIRAATGQVGAKGAIYLQRAQKNHDSAAWLQPPPPTVVPPQRSSSVAWEFPNHLRHAWRALTANKTRTILSTLGILIGVAAVIAMLAIGAGARRSIEAQLSSLGSNLLVLRPGAQRTHGVALQAGSVTRFTLRDIEDIRNEAPHVKFVSGTAAGRAQAVFGNRNWNTQVLGTSPEYATMKNYRPSAGRFFTDDEFRMRARVALVGTTLVRELYGNANPIGEYVKINKIIFQVIGVLPEKGVTGWRDQDDLIIIPLTTAMRRLLGRDFVDSIEIEVADTSDISATEQAIKKIIIRNHRLSGTRSESFNIRNMTEILSALAATSQTMALLLLSIAGISLLVGGIGIMNIMLVSVTERTREIGIRKAIGARRRDILAQFLAEALVISLAGGLMGIALGCAVSHAISKLAEWNVAITWQSILLACGFSILVGIIFGIWPASKASRLNPIDALRYE